MKNLEKLTVLFCFFCLISCKKQESATISQQILFDTSNSFDFNRMISSAKYICLNSDSEDALFGDASKIVVHNGDFYVLDTYTNLLLIFNEKGEFKSRISQRGNGPGEYVSIADFDIDTEGNIYLYNGPKNELLKYDSQRKFIQSIALSFDIDNFAILPNHDFIFTLAKYNERDYKDFKVVITDSQLNYKEKFIEYEDFYDPNTYLESCIQKGNGHFLQYKPIDDKMYLFSEKGLEEIFFFNKSDYLPIEFRENQDELMEKHVHSYSFVMTTPLLVKDYLLGIILKRGEMYFFAYDLLNDRLYEEKGARLLPMFCVNDSTFLSIMSEASYPDYQSDKNLTDEQKAHIASGGTVVCLFVFIE